MTVITIIVVMSEKAHFLPPSLLCFNALILAIFINYVLKSNYSLENLFFFIMIAQLKMCVLLREAKMAFFELDEYLEHQI